MIKRISIAALFMAASLAHAADSVSVIARIDSGLGHKPGDWSFFVNQSLSEYYGPDKSLAAMTEPERELAALAGSLAYNGRVICATEVVNSFGGTSMSWRYFKWMIMNATDAPGDDEAFQEVSARIRNLSLSAKPQHKDAVRIAVAGEAFGDECAVRLADIMSGGNAETRNYIKQARASMRATMKKLEKAGAQHNH